MVSTPVYLSAAALGVVYWISKAYLNYRRYEQTREEFGCPPMKKYPNWDPILGLDYVYAMMKALKEHRFLEFQTETYSANNMRAWSAKFMGNRMVYCSDPENMKAISTSHRHCFAMEPIRYGNGAVAPFTGRGVSTSDGAKWKESRELVKPYFDRAGFTNLDRLGVHVDRLIRKIPLDGSTIDMQPLFQRWFLDTSTEFLFGETVNSLDNPENDWPQRDMVVVQRGLRLRLQLSSFVFLHQDKEWMAACKRIHRFLDDYIDKAYQQLEEEKKGKPATYANGQPRDDFLWTIARHVPDRRELRTQVTGVWIPSNETTSIFMSNTIFALSRHPEVVEKLRREVVAYGDKPLTFEGLRSINYLRWVINETHRLYPVSLQTVRKCVKDVALPRGGGEDGNCPIFCEKGDIVHCNRYVMQRDPAIWGSDADEFKPERWEHARPKFAFVPFGGGERICPAHVMVDTECSYTVFRLLQCFKAIESRDSEPYTAVMRLGPSNKNGVKVAFVPA